ncbi:hypothetical protein HMPREF0591_5218 [Mycobacterium parascrofulaceum ATCC BAA-614]|uniref:Uncharacterized protein n=1 Tax=Mycobacterium parascrofulaceum ATCC BAA-614 TaxID=525368 RepID=D5PGC4_9MYCO|nr:hypothetical protein HMPREF0591_5218 [Mycobacterium parascrofulaceum ATCC BAA-614]
MASFCGACGHAPEQPQTSRSKTCRARSRVLSVRGLKLAMPW